VNAETPGNARVVVVDDDEDLRVLLRLSLERDAQFTVVAEADDGQSGVTAVLAHRPDLVLLDIKMPVMDGIQALKVIRRQMPSTVVVMLSSWDTSSRAAQQCMELGAHGYLRKGDHTRTIPAQLREIVRGTRGEVGP
jgi:DNA-binding NarL/FixJ family response regulator